MMPSLANTQYWTGMADGNTGQLFLSFSGPVCADNCPLDRVLTYKNLIYLLDLQIPLSPISAGKVV